MFLWEGFGREWATRAAWRAPGVQSRYHRQAVMVPAGPQGGVFCIAKAQKDHVPVTAQRC